MHIMHIMHVQCNVESDLYGAIPYPTRFCKLSFPAVTALYTNHSLYLYLLVHLHLLYYRTSTAHSSSINSQLQIRDALDARYIPQDRRGRRVTVRAGNQIKSSDWSGSIPTRNVTSVLYCVDLL
jgi:hypothetical protein